MSEKPICLYDENAVYNFYIEESIIPKILDVINDSGLSFGDAKKVPELLKIAIDFVCNSTLEHTRFHYTSRKR